MFVAGLVAGFTGVVLGCVFDAKRVQNSVEVRPEASIARRQDSDAAVPAVGLVLRAAYFVRQSLTSSSRFAVGFCGWVVGSVFGAKRAQSSADVRPEASIARRHASDASVPAVVLVFTAAYLVMQSLTSASTSPVFDSGRGVVVGLLVASGVADSALGVSAPSGLSVGSGFVVGAGDVIGAVSC